MAKDHQETSVKNLPECHRLKSERYWENKIPNVNTGVSECHNLRSERYWENNVPGACEEEIPEAKNGDRQKELH